MPARRPLCTARRRGGRSSRCKGSGKETEREKQGNVRVMVIYINFSAATEAGVRKIASEIIILNMKQWLILHSLEKEVCKKS